MRLGTRRCEDCLRRGMAGCSHSSSCLALKLTGLPAADFLFITVRAWWGTEGIRRKGGEAGEPTNSQAEQQCPQVSAAKPGATPYPFSLPSELSFPLSFTEKKGPSKSQFSEERGAECTPAGVPQGRGQKHSAWGWRAGCLRGP